MDLDVRRSAAAKRIHLRCRAARWARYASTFPPRAGEAVLDCGVSPLVDLPGENAFLAHYPFPDQVTGVSNDPSIAGLTGHYPKVRFVVADGRHLPFADRAFDVVHSNAVIEHVGPEPEQAAFLAELVRVGRAGYVSTPNRWFPFDSHTNLPLLHWLPREAFLSSLRRAGRLGPSDEWITWLLSSRQFRRVAPAGVSYALHRQRLAGMTAVLTLVFRHPAG